MYCEIPQFARCCCCLPLKLGIIIIGFINIIYLVVSVSAFCKSKVEREIWIYHGVVIVHLENGVSLAISCIDLFFNIVLVFAAGRKNILYLKVSKYFALANMALIVALQMLELFWTPVDTYYMLIIVPIVLVGLGINLYLYLLIRSLIIKLEISAQNTQNLLLEVNGLKAEGKEDLRRLSNEYV